MIHRFEEVVPGILYRGSAPSPSDVQQLQQHYSIKKIVSLDQRSGERINRTCKLLGIEHIMLPIGMEDLRASILNFLKHDLKKLLLDGGPTYIHCREGKDRTGFAVALVECKYLGIKPEEAIRQAQRLGFGIAAPPPMIHLFEKIILNCGTKQSKDVNHADIVSNTREYKSDNRDSFLDEAHQGSFAPYLSKTLEYPYDSVNNYINEQSPSRQNYQEYKNPEAFKSDERNAVPQVGVYNSDAGIGGFGPIMNFTGFFYD